MISCSYDKENDGISPVIGVILMVAITVVLAAVVGTFILDITGNLSRNAEATVDFSEKPYSGSSDGNLRTQIIAMQNADSVLLIAPDGTEMGKMTNVGDTVNITITDTADYPNKKIEAGDIVTVVGVLEGHKSTLQKYETSG